MKVQAGSKVRCLIDNFVVTIKEVGYFGVGQHLGEDEDGYSWVVDEDMIDSQNPDINEFTLIKE